MISRVHYAISIAVLLAGSVLSIAVYFSLPSRVPAHWNAKGQPDAFDSPWLDAFVLPIVSWVLVSALLAAPTIGPFKSSLTRFARTYGRICVTIASMLVAIQIIVLLAAAGKIVSIGQALTVVAGLAITIMGNWFGKIRRNPYVGIRTPWTLGDDEVWERTHRAGGKLSFGFGLVVCAVGVLAPPLFSLVFLLGGLIVLVIWSSIYSYRLDRALRSTRNMQ